MAKRIEYKFRIVDAYTPENLPMAQLAEYMADLAKMLGEPHAVHFIRLEEGSCQLVHQVEYEAAPKIAARLRAVKLGDAPPEAAEAYKRINKRLREDNGVAVLTETVDEAPAGKTAVIIEFPGRETVEPIAFGAFNQRGSLDGVPILVGGRGDPVPVHLELEDRVYNAEAKRSLAREIAKHLFVNHVRVTGMGRWRRDEEGRWVLVGFRIETCDLLDDRPLGEVVKALRKVEGNEWAKLRDPWAELERIRTGGNGER